MSAERPRVGISRCLLGETVRYDGGHRRLLVLEALAAQVHLVGVCPELEAGLGVPRPPMQLVRTPSGLRLREVAAPTRDHTRALQAFVGPKIRELADLDGFVLKSRSPSCGLEGVPVFNEAGTRLEKTGRGLFAAALLAACPGLPVIEEGSLLHAHDVAVFLERVVAHAHGRRAQA